MSAIVCGKRSVFEESIYIPSPPVTKRARCGQPASPSRLPWADESARLPGPGGVEEKILVLRSMFGEVDDQVIHQVLEACNHDIDSAILSLKGLRIMSSDSTPDAKLASEPSQVSSQPGANCIEQTAKAASEPALEAVTGDGGSGAPKSGAEWVEVVVKEMMSAVDLADARQRAASVLEVFEKEVRKRCEADISPRENGKAQVLQQHVATLLKENQILKRAVAIQHERQREHQACAEELVQLRHTLAQYQEQLRKLEVNNYALSLHLQKAQDAAGSSLPGRFHPDVF